MRSQFEFYDFVAYLIPGMFFILIFFWFSNEVFGPLSFLDSKGIAAGAVLLLFSLAGSYAMGHLAQGIASILERSGRVIEKRSVLKDALDKPYYFSPKLLKEIDQEKLIKLANETFDLSLTINVDDQSQHDRTHKEMRRMCLSHNTKRYFRTHKCVQWDLSASSRSRCDCNNCYCDKHNSFCKRSVCICRIGDSV